MHPSLAVDAFHFLRHGRTAHNVSGTVQGHLDIPLDEEGRHQANAAATYLAGVSGIRRVVSSDLSRAFETAAAVAGRLGVAVEVDRDLRERSFGPHEGKRSFSELWDRPVEGVEAIEAMAERVAGALSRHLDEPGTLLVAHGGVLRVVAWVLAVDLPRTALRNAAPLRFERDAGAWAVNDLTLSESGQDITWETT